VKKLEFGIVGLVLVAMMYGCGGTSTGGTKGEESGKQVVKTENTATTTTSTVSMSKLIAYGADSSIPEKVKAECTLNKELPEYIESFANTVDIKVVRKGGIVSSKDKGKVLVVEFTDVVGAGGGAWSGSKAVGVSGELFENGKKIGSFKGRRTSGGGLWGAYKGTCSILGRCVKALGKDISEWLINPTMNARLGEM
jgi:hypothetical protein